MTLIQAFILGLTQGLTEFLPVSSSGHLVIIQNLFKLDQPPVLFDIFVHLATALAIILVFWPALIKLTRKNIFFIAIASLPAAVIGLLLNSQIQSIFSSLKLVALALFITSLLLFSIQFFLHKAKKNKPKLLDAFIIGCFQALAIIPGISRSGSTISSAVFMGLKPISAFNFSFILSLPAVLGAQLLYLPELTAVSNNQLPFLLIGFITALISGFFSLKFLKQLIIKGKLNAFAYYCLTLASSVFIYSTFLKN